MKENYNIRLIWWVSEYGITVYTDHERPTKLSALDFGKQSYANQKLYNMGLRCIIITHPEYGFVKRVDVLQRHRQVRGGGFFRKDSPRS